MTRIAIAAVALTALLAACGDDDSGSDETTAAGTESTAVSEEDRELAITQAEVAFARAKSGGFDLSTGPCVAEVVNGLPDWVVDIAHDPREPVDEDPANQCKRYIKGKAHHVVELTPGGELIRAE